METFNKLNFIFRFVLVGLILLSIGISTIALLTLIAYKPEDFVFSLIVVIIAMVFALFEMVLTLIRIKKPLSIYKIGITDRGYINPIPMIAVIIGAVIGLTMTTLGIVFFFVRTEAIIKCNSLVILSIGVYLLLNCAFYLIYIPIMKKQCVN